MKKIMIVGILLLVVCVGVFFLITTINKNNKEEKVDTNVILVNKSDVEFDLIKIKLDDVELDMKPNFDDKYINKGATNNIVMDKKENIKVYIEILSGDKELGKFSTTVDLSGEKVARFEILNGSSNSLEINIRNE